MTSIIRTICAVLVLFQASQAVSQSTDIPKCGTYSFGFESVQRWDKDVLDRLKPFMAEHGFEYDEKNPELIFDLRIDYSWKGTPREAEPSQATVTDHEMGIDPYIFSPSGLSPVLVKTLVITFKSSKTGSVIVEVNSDVSGIAHPPTNKSGVVKKTLALLRRNLKGLCQAKGD